MQCNPAYLVKKVGKAARLVGASDIEGRFPDRDLAVAHDPNLDTDSPHGTWLSASSHSPLHMLVIVSFIRARKCFFRR